MAEDTFNQGGWPEDRKEGPIPPLKPDVDVRTFSSDIKSVSDSGGGPPKPYTPEVITPPSAPQPPKEEKQSFSQVFPESKVESAPVPTSFPPGPTGVQEFGVKKSKKNLFVGILVFIIVVGLVALGYFFIYPLFFQETEEVAEITSPPPQEQVSPPAEAPVVPEVPVVVEEEVATTSEEESLPETPPPAVIAEHVSLFKTAADVSTNITLASVDVSSYKNAIEFLTAQVPILKEIVFKDNEGNLVGFGNLMGVLLPDVFTSELNQSFEPDFTLFTYTDSKGTWLGLVVKLKSGSSLTETKTTVQKIETSTNLKNIFITDPGTASAWKTGQVNGKSSRYLTFSQEGAALSYTWFDNYLLISTNYDGAKRAATSLGF